MDLVTGGAGFLGAHLVAALRSRGRRVRVLDLRDPHGFPGDVERVMGSVTDPVAVGRAVRGVTRIFHTAAIPELWTRDPDSFERVNHEGTLRLLDAAHGRDELEAFVHTSSETVLVPRAGEPCPDRLDENLELAPGALIGPYARSKRRAELAVLDAARHGLPAVSAIPTMPLGPGDHRGTPPTRMVRDLLAGKTPALLDAWLNVVDVRDAAMGHLLAAAHGRRGARYLLAGHNRRLPAFAHELAEITGRSMPTRRVPAWLALAAAWVDETVANRVTRRPPRAPLEGARIACRQRPFDSARARTRLGFAPRELTETLAATAYWLGYTRG